MRRKWTLFIAVSLAIVSLAGCGGKTTTETPQTPQETADDAASANAEKAEKPDKTYQLRVSGMDGSIGLFPVYVAMENGAFEAAGLEIERIGFTNGPVQMEAIDTWDIGTTGIGGTLTGVITYDAVMVGVCAHDDGAQYIYARPDSAIAAAGTGSNTISNEILGDADSWKASSVNCTYGTVLHYLLAKTLEGFGVTVDEVNVNWMDRATCNTAFLSGEGDAAAVSDTSCYSDDKADYLVASTGTIAQTNMYASIMANPESLKDAEKAEAIEIFLKVYFETCDELTADIDAAIPLMVEWSDYAGATISEDIARNYLEANSYVLLEENYNALHTNAEGEEYTVMEGWNVDILRFFIDCENYQAGDDDIYLQEKHIDTSFIDTLYEQ